MAFLPRLHSAPTLASQNGCRALAVHTGIVRSGFLAWRGFWPKWRRDLMTTLQQLACKPIATDGDTGVALTLRPASRSSASTTVSRSVPSKVSIQTIACFPAACSKSQPQRFSQPTGVEFVPTILPWRNCCDGLSGTVALRSVIPNLAWIASREDKRIALPTRLTLEFPPHSPDKTSSALCRPYK